MTKARPHYPLWALPLPAIRFGFGGVLMAIAAVNGPAAADDHDEPEPRTIVVSPRAETRIGAQELVIAYLGGRVVVFMQRYVDGVPTSGAEIEVTIDLLPETLTEIAPGIYSSGPWPLAAGRNDVELAYTLGDEKGTAALPMVVASTSSTGVPANAIRPIAKTAVGTVLPGFVLAALAILIYAGVTGLLVRRSRRA